MSRLALEDGLQCERHPDSLVNPDPSSEQLSCTFAPEGYSSDSAASRSP